MLSQLVSSRIHAIGHSLDLIWRMVMEIGIVKNTLLSYGLVVGYSAVLQT